jgi:hypothetical protein
MKTDAISLEDFQQLAIEGGMQDYKKWGEPTFLF